MSSSASEAPCEIAKLCSNCQKVQFREETPHLHQSGPHLELDQELIPKERHFGAGGSLPTGFTLTDSYPDLPNLWKSSQDGCDFCKFLYEIFVSFVSQDLSINIMSGCNMSISIAYTWGMLSLDGNDPLEELHELPSGLDAMKITAEFSSDEIRDIQIAMKMICHVESACGEYFQQSSPRSCTLRSWYILTAVRFVRSSTLVAPKEPLQPGVL